MLDLDILKDWLYEESDTISEEFLNGDTWDGNFRVAKAMTANYAPGNPVVPGDQVEVAKKPVPRKLVDTAPGGAPPQLHPEEVSGAGIPLDEDPYHMLTPEEVRRIHLMREKAAKFASLKQAKDCDCWEGYKRVPGTKPCAPGSCEKCDSGKKSSANEQEHSFVEVPGGEDYCQRCGCDLQDSGGPCVTDEELDSLDMLYPGDAAATGRFESENHEASRRQASERNANFAEFVNEAAQMFPDAGASIETNDNGEIILLVHDHLAGENATDQILELAQNYGLQAGDPDRMGYGPNAIFSGDIFPELSWQTGLLSDMPDAIFYAEGKTEREASRRQAEVAWDGGGANKNERGTWAWGHQEPKADESGLDDAPSGPAMDKTRWQPAALDPNGKGNLKPVDTEYPGSPNPTIQQVLWERREDEDVYGQQEFGDGINSVTDKQELPAADETGLTTEKNLNQGSQGGTFPNEGQANPVTSKVANEESECLDCHPDDPCEGSVEPRMPLSGTGKSFPRCEKHFDQRLQRQNEINQRYPHNAPSDFDPGYAGERWDDEY